MSDLNTEEYVLTFVISFGIYKHMDNYVIHIAEEDSGQRLDKVLAEKLMDISRSRLQALIAEGAVRCDSVLVSSGKGKVVEGQCYEIMLPEITEAIPLPQNIPLNIVYEDEHLLVINKQVGLVVHPGAGNHDGTLVNALLYHCGNSLSGIGGVRRPGIVHRLDKDTSGLMVVAKNDAAHAALSQALQERDIKRVYHAFCWGRLIPESGKVDLPLGRDSKNRLKIAVQRSKGRHAVTHYKTREFFGEGEYGVSVVECRLETGRTHQIRVHMQTLGANLIGDTLYGAPISKIKAMIKKGYLAEENNEKQRFFAEFSHQALHAVSLSFVHPATQELMQFTSPYPADLQKLYEGLKAKG